MDGLVEEKEWDAKTLVGGDGDGDGDGDSVTSKPRDRVEISMIRSRRWEEADECVWGCCWKGGEHVAVSHRPASLMH